MKKILAFNVFFIILLSGCSGDNGNPPHIEIDNTSNVIYNVENIFGGTGTEDGKFNSPKGIIEDSEGNSYIVDSGNNRIQKFDSEGNFILKWGKEGTENGEFNNPVGIAIDNDENIYITDTFNNRIQKFDSLGNFMGSIGKEGSNCAEFKYPIGITIDSENNIYVVDSGNHRIQKFNSKGSFLFETGKNGQNEREFHFPSFITTDSSGNIYVVDSGNHRVEKFRSNGTYVTMLGGYGDDEGSFIMPLCIDTDEGDFIYIGDSGKENRIQKFHRDGTLEEVIIANIDDNIEKSSENATGLQLYDDIFMASSYKMYDFIDDISDLYDRIDSNFNFTENGYHYRMTFRDINVKDLIYDIFGLNRQRASISSMMRSIESNHRACLKHGCLNGTSRRECNDILWNDLAHFKGIISHSRLFGNFDSWYSKIMGKNLMIPNCSLVDWKYHGVINCSFKEGETYDFGNIYLEGLKVKSRRVSISNKYEALADLKLTGDPVVEISGPDSDNFKYFIGKNRTITPEHSIPFYIVFLPDDEEQKNATITIKSNDPTNEEYTFHVTAISKPLPPDSYESMNDNTFSTSNTFDVDDSQQEHNLHLWEDVDYIKIKAEKDVAYNIETSLFTMDTNTIIHLYDSSQNLMTYNDRSGKSDYSRIRWECQETDDYYVKVGTTGFSYVGDYRLSINTITMKMDQYESDDDTTTQNKIIIGDDPQEHNFHTGSDSDYIKLNTVKGTIYDIYVQDGSSNSEADLRLVYQNDNTITSGLKVPGGSRIMWTCNSTGNYYINIKNSLFKKANYLISVTTYDDNISEDNYESDDLADDAKLINVDGVPQQHTFHNNFDLDICKFNAAAGETYVISTDMRSIITDTGISLFNESMDLIQNDENSGEGNYSKIVWQCTKSSEYFLTVKNNLARKGDYYLKLERAYAIKGTVECDSAGVKGVTINLFQNNNIVSVTESESDGSFEFKNIVKGTYKIVPQNTQYKFNPTENNLIVTSNILNINFSGIEKKWEHPETPDDSFTPILTGFHYNHHKHVNLVMNNKGDTVITWIGDQRTDSYHAYSIYKSEFRNSKWTHPKDFDDYINPVQKFDYAADYPYAAINDKGETVLIWSSGSVFERKIYLAEYKNYNWTLPVDGDYINNISWRDAEILTRGLPIQLNENGDAIIAWTEWQNEGVYLSEHRYGHWHQNTMIFSKGKGHIVDTVMNKNGDTIVAFAQNVDGERLGNNDLYKLFIAEYRNGVWKLPTVDDYLNSDNTSVHSGTVSLDMNEKGEAILAWMERDVSKGSSYFSEYYDGQWHHPQSKSDTLDIENYGAVIQDAKIADNGDIVILWTQTNGLKFDGYNNTLHMYINEKRNGIWNNTKSLDAHIDKGEYYCVSGKIKINKNGETIIVWEQNVSSINGSSLYRGFKSEYKNGSWIHPSSIDDFFTNSEYPKESGIEVEIDLNGNKIIVWHQQDGNPFNFATKTYVPYKIFMKECINNVWSETICIGAKSYKENSYQLEPQIVINDNGEKVIIWEQITPIYSNVNGATDTRSNLYMSQYR